MSESERIALVEIKENGKIQIDDWINDMHDEHEIPSGDFEEEYGDIYEFLEFCGTKTYEDYFEGTRTIGTAKTRVKIIEHEKKESSITNVEKYQAIIEGRCHNCGSNRLEYGFKEPDGVSYVECPVCGKVALDGKNDEWNYRIGV